MVDMKFFAGESILNGRGTITLVGTMSFAVEVIGWNLTIFKIARKNVNKNNKRSSGNSCKSRGY